MTCPSSGSGVGQDLVSTFFNPRMISLAQGWCRVMTYIRFYGSGERFRRSTTGTTPEPRTAWAMTPETLARRNGGWANQIGYRDAPAKHRCNLRQAIDNLGRYDGG